MASLANPKRFMDLSGRLVRWFVLMAGVLLAAGFYLALFVVPPDYQQGESVRIMFVHVPAAWMSIFVYALIAAASFAGLVFAHPLADVAAKAAAPYGAMFTALALVTGSLWGKPMWGAYWAWDARLTSELVLLFIYFGYMALWAAIEDPARAGRLAAILALVGAVDLPIIHFSVDWWREHTLHQPASVVRMDGPALHGDFLWPLLIMALGYMALFFALWLTRMRTEILSRRARVLILQGT
ncbi:MAG: heme ABC transporter permease [Alphaproteobacteria bacterium]